MSRKFRKRLLFGQNFLTPFSVKYLCNSFLWLVKISIQQLSKQLSGLTTDNGRSRTQFQHHQLKQQLGDSPSSPPAVAKFLFPTFVARSKKKQTKFNICQTRSTCIVFIHTGLFSYPTIPRKTCGAQWTLPSIVSGSSGLGSSLVLCSWARHFTLTVP